MAISPCGCEALEQAELRGRVEREALEINGVLYQEAWRCPIAGHVQAQSINELPASTQRCHERAQLLVESKLPPTCPMESTRRPWIGQALKAWRAFEKGQLESIYGEPSCVLMEAIDLISVSLAKKIQWEIDHPKESSADKK